MVNQEALSFFVIGMAIFQILKKQLLIEGRSYFCDKNCIIEILELLVRVSPAAFPCSSLTYTADRHSKVEHRPRIAYLYFRSGLPSGRYLNLSLEHYNIPLLKVERTLLLSNKLHRRVCCLPDLLQSRNRHHTFQEFQVLKPLCGSYSTREGAPGY